MNSLEHFKFYHSRNKKMLKYVQAKNKGIVRAETKIDSSLYLDDKSLSFKVYSRYFNSTVVQLINPYNEMELANDNNFWRKPVISLNHQMKTFVDKRFYSSFTFTQKKAMMNSVAESNKFVAFINRVKKNKHDSILCESVSILVKSSNSKEILKF
jgi:hypothetical protein